MSQGENDTKRPDTRETLEQLRKLQQKLKESVELATVVFFDLVASTKYRRDHGAPKGLDKAEQHNNIVSASVLNHGGEIVKLLGDGVMAMFRGDENGVPHPIRALQAGLDSINRLWVYNEPILDQNWFDKIQTKVGLSTGNVHLLPAGSGEEKDLSNRLDPMGSTVDLAARLETLAMPDTILIDRFTFWGEPFQDLKDETPPVCQTPETNLNRNKKRAEGLGKPVSDFARAHGWRELILDKERESTYLPQAAPFQLLDGGLKVLELPGADKLISPTKLKEQADQFSVTGDETDKDPVVFACEPVDCNIAGFKDRVEAIAVSLEPQQKPVKQSVYESPISRDIEIMLDDADRLYHDGNEKGARTEYEKVLKKENDPRDFRANVRLAQYWRRRNKRAIAGEYWNEAKKSNPNHGMIWALAGTTHLETFIINNANLADNDSAMDPREINEHRNRSITGFTRARQLASEAFDSPLEQHCTCFLVICHSLRKRNDDISAADMWLERLKKWPPQTPQLAILRDLAEAFFYIVSEGRAYELAADVLLRAKEKLKQCKEQHAQYKTNASDPFRKDMMMEAPDFELLVQLADFRLGVAIHNE